MTLDSHTTQARPGTKHPVSAPRRQACECKHQALDVAGVVRALPERSTCFVAQAPGWLDVMGGLGDYSGSLVLSMPIGGQVCVAVQATTKPEFTIAQVDEVGKLRGERWSRPMAHFFDGEGSAIDATTAVERLAPSRIEACLVGAVVELLRAGVIKPITGGLSVAVRSDLHNGCDVGNDAAYVAALLCAVTAAFDRTLELPDAALICQRVANDWLARPIGIADATCTLAGETNSVNAVRCEPCQKIGVVGLSEQLTILGIDTGARRADAALRYERVRTASFMGRALIDIIRCHEAVDAGERNGYLSHITVAQYVEGLRDRLPTKLLGGEYLDRFGETGDPLTRVDPAHAYRIRSRTEHHIYEHARAAAYYEVLARAVSENDRAAAGEIGELMYASHWSYGQRCGLGSVEADFLVSILRKFGTGADVFGARTAGRGCGGLVCVLMANSEKAQHAIRLAVEAAAKKFGHEPQVLGDSASGALVRGAQRV